MRAKAQCVFDLFDLKFLMSRKDVVKLLDLDGEGMLSGENLNKIGASSAQFFFDHLDRLWQAKVYYVVDGHEEAQQLLEKMSEDYRFQTPSTRVAFDLSDNGGGEETLYIRYTEINVKRVYMHHMMAVGAAKKEAEDERERIIREHEEEEIIPSGPLIF